ncbi:MAG: DUF6476 family protein [Geminicoccaceae bacterium]
MLKAFVIAGGVVLLIGVVLLAVLIMLQVSGQNDQAREEGPAAPVDLALPSGARITQVVADGRRLVLLAEDADGRQYLAVVDAASGERQSLIRITPADAADIK